MKHLELGFIGFGLIGGSLARALKRKGADVSIKVYTRRKNPNLDQGVSEGIIDELVYAVDSTFSTCDIIFLCAPVQKNIDYLEILKPIIQSSCILTDVGSVKGSICQAADRIGLSRQFIGGHPMAGSEKTGFENATDSLLENAYYLLTPNCENKPEDIQLLKELIDLTGANCVTLSYEEHDRITAAISHVPHVIAVSLVHMVRENDSADDRMKLFAAGGFRDITRIASSSPEMWRDICLSNRECIRDFLLYFEHELEEFREILSAKDGEKIRQLFESAGDYRNSIPNKKSSIISRSYDLFVNVDDRTGAIASIATILSNREISIKNIGIIHNREYADGVLRLELYSKQDASEAKKILSQHSYTIISRE